MRKTGIISALCTIFLSGSLCYAEPPKLEIDSQIVTKGDYLTITPKTDAKTIVYIGLSGVDPLPSDLLKDSKTFLLFTALLKEGEYEFSAIAIKQDEYTRVNFKVIKGKVDPKVDPVPPKPPEPQPSLDKAPVNTSGLHVAFIVNSNGVLTSDQFDILYGQSIRSYLDKNCDRDTSTPQWRILSDKAVSDNPIWSDVVKRNRKSIPWVVIVHDKKYVYEGPLGSKDELVKILDKYKGVARYEYCPTCPNPLQLVPIK